MRGMDFSGGDHDFTIRTGGLQVCPRLKITESPTDTSWNTINSGNNALDTMLGGGLEEGTSCLVTGTSGAGKSTLTSLYVEAAAQRGEKSIMYCFDERINTLIRRTRALNMKFPDYIGDLITINQINVGDISPGVLLDDLHNAVEKQGIKIVVIDSLSGYIKAMPEERQLITQLHELTSYLANKNVLTFMILTTHGIVGNITSEIDASYLADTVILLRHFEAMGKVRKCISVIKKRHGSHENTLREMLLDKNGVHIGPPLEDFSGLLTGVPRYEGRKGELIKKNKHQTE